MAPAWVTSLMRSGIRDPGLCDYVSGYLGGAVAPAHDGNVATVEVSIGGGTCSNAADANAYQVFVDCGFASFDICGSVDGDGDFSVNALDFCTTPDCVAAAQVTLASGFGPATGDRCAVPVPFSACLVAGRAGHGHQLVAGCRIDEDDGHLRGWWLAAAGATGTASSVRPVAGGAIRVPSSSCGPAGRFSA